MCSRESALAHSAVLNPNAEPDRPACAAPPTGFELVRRIGQKASLRGQRFIRALPQRNHPPPPPSGTDDLFGTPGVQGRQIFGLAAARMRSSRRLRGSMPRASASHTSSTASGKMTNCGSITPLMISAASSCCAFPVFGHLHQRLGAVRGQGQTQSRPPCEWESRATHHREHHLASRQVEALGRAGTLETVVAGDPGRHADS